MSMFDKVALCYITITLTGIGLWLWVRIHKPSRPIITRTKDGTGWLLTIVMKRTFSGKHQYLSNDGYVWRHSGSLRKVLSPTAKRLRKLVETYGWTDI